MVPASQGAKFSETESEGSESNGWVREAISKRAAICRKLDAGASRLELETPHVVSYNFQLVLANYLDPIIGKAFVFGDDGPLV